MAGNLSTSPRLQALYAILAERARGAGPRRSAWISQTDLISAMLRRVGKAGAVHSDIYDLRADRDGSLRARGLCVPTHRRLRRQPGGERVPHYCLARVGQEPPPPLPWQDAPRDAVAPRGIVRRVLDRLLGAA